MVVGTWDLQSLVNITLCHVKRKLQLFHRAGQRQIGQTCLLYSSCAATRSAGVGITIRPC